MRCERGQTTIEWTGLMLVLALALGALAAVVPSVNGRSFGGFLTHRIACAIKGGCDDGDAELARAYGKREAERVRDLAPDIAYEPGEPSIPVDYRECRTRACSETPSDRDLDAHRTVKGRRATVFTHVVRRNGRTYIQYWFYYPDSNSTALASDRLWKASGLRLVGRYPGYHPDDWEGWIAHVVRCGQCLKAGLERSAAFKQREAQRFPRSVRDVFTPAGPLLALDELIVVPNPAVGGED